MELDLFKSSPAAAEARSFSRSARANHSTKSDPQPPDRRRKNEPAPGPSNGTDGTWSEPPAKNRSRPGPSHHQPGQRRDQLMRAGGGRAEQKRASGPRGACRPTCRRPALASSRSSPQRERRPGERNDAACEDVVIRGESDHAVTTRGSARTVMIDRPTEEILREPPQRYRLAAPSTGHVGALASESIPATPSTMTRAT